MNLLINFRDKGCQGAIYILEKAKDIILNKSNLEIQNCSAKRLVYVVSVDIKERIFIKINFYKEIASILGLEFRIVDIDATLDEKDIIILDSHYLDKIEEIKKIGISALLVEDSMDDFRSSYAIANFVSLIYLAIKNNKNFEDIGVQYVGNAGIHNENFVKFLLNTSICMKNNLAFAFENNKDNKNISMPHKDNLDFAMNAGAKIFLTHDIEMLDDNADICYIAQWNANEDIKHPFSSIQANYTDNTQIVSFLSGIKSSQIDEDLYYNVALNTRLVALSYLLTQ